MCAKQKWPKNEKWTKTKRKMGCGKIPGEMTTKSKKSAARTMLFQYIYRRLKLHLWIRWRY